MKKNKVKALNGRELTEKQQDFEYPSTWSEQELYEFYEIIQRWIMDEDHYYNLYAYLRNLREDPEILKWGNPSEPELKFGRLYNKYLKNSFGSKHMKLLSDSYVAERIQWEKQRELRNQKSMLEANVQGGIN